ncbi:hypothetical protein [Georgenia thermotolerans]|uniref:Uncharacterized protein n=1 Tax=Georgenia thermotolerans TaxID=527326 RepID=A0A7J5URY7_9MICO|nr:hypothetical protein [Georgenia thermotolerans]KAE8765128.1 hypothetical protein GB883_05355 [Georgenia thermotolerans]
MSTVGVQGDPAVSTDVAGAAGGGKPRRPRRRLAALGGALVALLATVTVVTSSVVSGHESPGALTVAITDAGSPTDESCSAEDYAGSFFDGTEVALLDADGAVVDSRVVKGAGQPSKNGCLWTVELIDVPQSDAYTLRLRGTGIPAREHTFHYTPEQLAERSWNLWVTVFA